MMNKKEFFDYVKDNVLDYLPDKFAQSEIKLMETPKNNDTILTGIVIRDGDSDIAPNIYLDSFYEKYQEGADIDSLVGNVADLRIEHQDPDFELDTQILTGYESVKDKLQLRICDPEMNTERLNGKPFTIVGDFAAYYAVVISESDRGIASAPVTDSLMERWGVDIATIHQDALAADANRGSVLASMDQLMEKMIFDGAEPENLFEVGLDMAQLDFPMLVLTNEHRTNGAAGILNEDLRKQIGEMIGSDFYVLPSSIHETLIVPDDGNFNAETLNTMVEEVNLTQVSPEERLSDKVQFCDGKTGVMENAKKREMRLAQEKTAEKTGIRGRLEKAKAEVKSGATQAMTIKPKEKSASMAL